MSTADHYADTFGTVPRQIALMQAMDGEVHERYTALRELFYRDREDGLSRATKELLFIALSAAIGNPHGARNHLEPARRAGATTEQIKEVLILVLMVTGANGWGQVGCEVWEAWTEGADA